MKITRKKLRKIISETYRKAQRASAAQYKNPNKEYAKTLASFLGVDPLSLNMLNSKRYQIDIEHKEGIPILIVLPGTVSWPYGAMITFQDPMSYRQFHYQIHFPISGEPSIDAEFINRLVSRSILELGNIADAAHGYWVPSKTGSGFTKIPPTTKQREWIDRIMPGYPGAFLQ